MFTPKSFRTILYVILMICLTACLPVATQEPRPEPTAIVEPATLTPEVFNPLDPSPTASDSDLPLTCQVTDLNVYIDRAAGFCFAYPIHFTLGDQPSDAPEVMSPALEDSLESVRVSLGITTHPIPEGSELTSLVDAYLTTFPNPPWPITRETLTLGSEPAEKLEPIPGLLSSRVVLTLHGNTLYTLHFHPVDVEIAKPDLDALYQTVTGSFAFLPETTELTSTLQKVSWYEFGKNISLSYDSLLAPWVTAQTVPAVPLNDQILFAEARPTYAQFRFYGFQGGRLYDLPQLPFDNRMAQVMVFQTTDFPGYGDDTPYGFVNQMQALKDLLANGIDPAQCAKPYAGTVTPLPFLPWINYQQTFCAHPQILQFSGGQGIRYLSYYSQGINPVLDHEVFYTFQGLTDDGQFYISALFPVATGIFPTEPPPCPKCGEADYNPLPEWTAILTEQLNQLNVLAADGFAPPLTALDELVESIVIGQ
jgi:hypothetical protein